MANIGKIMGIAVSTGTSTGTVTQINRGVASPSTRIVTQFNIPTTGTSTVTQINCGVASPSTRIVTQFNIPTAGAFRPGTSDGT